MCGIGKGAESTTGQKVQKAQLCNTCSTPLEAQFGMLGNAPDRIAGHRHGSAFGGAGVPSTFEIVSQGLGGLHPVNHPGSSPQLHRLWPLLTLCRITKHSRLRRYADIKARK